MDDDGDVRAEVRCGGYVQSTHVVERADDEPYVVGSDRKLADVCGVLPGEVRRG